MPLRGLTEEQIAAATAPAEPTVIVAGPGSGKTRTIVARAAWYAQAIPPNRILLVTFTNKAAKEARSRLSAWGSGFVASTFHSLCARHLLPVTGGSIADEDEALSVMKEVIKEGRLGLDAKPIAEWISMQRNKGYTLERPPDSITDEVRSVWEGYEKLKDQYRLHDFDDLLEDALRFYVIDSVAPFFQLVLVDETQDTNRPQFEITRRLAAPHRNLTMVGDMDQSIYGWRGAVPENIRDFADEFDAKVYPLTANHRSTGRIVSLSRRVIEQHPSPIRAEDLHSVRAEGHEPQVVECLDSDQEAEKVAQWAQDLIAQGAPPTEIAVLIRTNAQSQPLEAAFAYKKIPYTVVGALSFFARAEIKDALSFLRVAANPFDVPAFRRSAMCMNGLGGESVKAVVNEAAISKGSLLESLATVRAGIRSEARAGAFLAYEDIMSDLATLSPAEAVKRVAEDSLGLKYEEDEREQFRMDNLDRLYQLAGRFDNLRDFLTMVTLATASDEEHKGVCVATCHAVKGLEFQAVWVAGVETGLFPHSRAEDKAEECRLLYVACTRAKDLLVLSWCQVRRKWDDIIKCRPSPFLEALTGGQEEDA